VDESYIGDDIKLKEVLLNILTNAVKYTEKSGSVTLTVEKTAEFADQSTLRFCIRDTGIGMDKELVSTLFDLSSKGNSVKRSKNSGLGLGMPITKRIVEMMNGSISVKSEEGVGTEIIVMVTLLKGNSSEAEHSAEVDLQAMYILVVDDSPVEAKHAQMVLDEVGILADICSSGPEALQKIELQHAKKHPYNMVLMDWNMPGMNGMETSAEIIRLYDKECTVVAMTAYSWDEIQEEADKVGVKNFLGKPLYANNIVENISQIARRSGMAIFKEKKKARLEGRRILLAEDVEINAEILMDMLEMDNIKVDHAENGKEAVELFENSTSGIYSAILMDVRMPEMDGLEATRVIRAMEREDAKRIPIIALTANAFDEDVQCSLQAGMNAHLSKPVEAELLIRILGELIYEAEESINIKF
jgi:CheY-like chemotaxis protein